MLSHESSSRDVAASAREGGLSVSVSSPSSASFGALEAAARSALGVVAAEREATFARALAFMHACHAALYADLEALTHLQAEKDASEMALIAAETEACTSGEVVGRTEESRRFLVNRVRCAAWEKKSHFHLTALDHMLGNVQPALFDVASMLRGHLAICAMARSAMVAQSALQAHIARQLETKELSFRRVKELREELEDTLARTEEYKDILRSMKKEIGHDLERFIERRRRAKRGDGSITATPDKRTTSMYVPAIMSPPEEVVTGFGPLRLTGGDASSTDPLSPFSPVVRSRSPSRTNPTTPVFSTVDAVSPSRRTSPHSWNGGHSPTERSTAMNTPRSSSPPHAPWTLPSAPPLGVSLLVSTLAVGDVWPDELEAMATSHLEQLAHPTHAGASSHSREEGTPPSSPPQHSSSQLGTFASALVTSPPRGQIQPHSSFPKATDRSSRRRTSAGSRSPRTPPSPAKLGTGGASGPPTARQGYLNIKMRYFQTLVASASPPGSPKPGATVPAAAVGATTDLVVSSSSSAATASAATSKWAARRSSRESSASNSPTTALPSFTSPPRPTSSSASSSPSSSAALSPQSTAAGGSTTAQAAAALSAAAPSLRPRAVFSAGHSGGATGDGENKRWLLRPLPANTERSASASSILSHEAEMDQIPELGPLTDATIHSSPSLLSPSSVPTSPLLTSSPSSPSFGSSPGSGGSSASSSFSLGPSAAPKKSWWSSLFKRGPKSTAELEREAAKEAERTVKKLAKEREKALKKAAKYGTTHPQQSHITAPTPVRPGVPALSRAVSGLSSLVGGSTSPTPRRLTEWRSLQQLYDEIASHATKQQAAWETLEGVLDRRERAAAEERRAALEAALERERRDKERAFAMAHAPRFVPPISAPIAVPLVAPPPKSPTPLVHSSHALSSSSSSMLLAGGGGQGSGSSPPPLLVGPATSPPATSPNASERPARKSVLSLLQSVPAPTLMTTEDPAAEHVHDHHGEASSASSSSITIPASLQAAAVLRSAVLAHLSRSQPSTPPAHSAHPSLHVMHGRRASDSQATTQQHQVSPRSAPPSVRSNSFSSSGYLSAAGSESFEPDFSLYYTDRRQFRHHHAQVGGLHHSPPSPGSLVC